jgi:hypothetical protein
VNARILLIPIISLPLLSGCASFGFFGKKVEPIQVQTVAVERTPLNLREPTPLKPKPLEWVVITPENAEEVWAKLRSNNSNVVIIGLTDDGYENLSITMAEIRNHMLTQSNIIKKYKEYYESKEDNNAKRDK